MAKTFFISDTHFGHYNICHKFELDDGSPSRINPETNKRFSSVEEMDELMIQRWNKTIGDQDRVYHLGDFCINRKAIKTLHRLNGRIKLVLGNHDLWRLNEYLEYMNVDYLLGSASFPALGWIATHIPVHPEQLQGRWTHNLHGHLHNKIMRDKRYVNCCVENINYTPLSLDELKERLDSER